MAKLSTTGHKATRRLPRSFRRLLKAMQVVQSVGVNGTDERTGEGARNVFPPASPVTPGITQLPVSQLRRLLYYRRLLGQLSRAIDDDTRYASQRYRYTACDVATRRIYRIHQGPIVHKPAKRPAPFVLKQWCNKCGRNEAEGQHRKG